MFLVLISQSGPEWKVGPCWRVQKALDEQGIDYEVVKGPVSPSKRVDLQRLSGQRLYPVTEFENGSIYREESKDMAATIRAGKLDEKRGRGHLTRVRAPCPVTPLDAECGSSRLRELAVGIGRVRLGISELVLRSTTSRATNK